MATPMLSGTTPYEGHVTSVAIAGTGLALISCLYFTRAVLTAPINNPLMEDLSKTIQKAAQAYLNTQYKWLLLWVCCLSIIIGAILRRPQNHLAGLYTMICYIVGSVLSGASGYAGMYIATSANARTAAACQKNMAEGLKVSFASGAVMGNVVTGLALGGLWVLYLIFTAAHPESRTDPFYFDMVWGYLAGFGFGASSIGMFARVGGGVFTKAADVGADLVGKVEQGIPEDDARNPAVIADNVGDNVGDVAGMGADLFESYAGALIACATLSPALYTEATVNGWTSMDLQEVMAAGAAVPFWIYGFGVVTSLAGIASVRATKLDDTSTLDTLLKTINRGIAISSFLSIGTAICACLIWFDNYLNWRLFGSIMIGLIAGVVIAHFTEYCTSYEDAPTRDISAASEFGPAPVIIKGMGIGMMSVSVPTISIVITILGCNALAGLYGVSIAAVGMLCTLGMTLATDAYGPVADNAGGIAEMAELPAFVRSRTDKLDSLGNTTAATGKGLAIGSALLTAVGLIAAFLQQSGMEHRNADLKDPIVLTGILIGTSLPFVFGSLTMLSVDRGARSIITEVRLQFATAPALMLGERKQIVDGVSYPDSERCVRIATEAAIQEMILPGMLAVFVPVGVGFLLGPKGLGGLLAGALGTCFMLALTMANAGGAWDNAKKWCERCAEEGEPLADHIPGSAADKITFRRFGVKKPAVMAELERTHPWEVLIPAGAVVPTTEEQKQELRQVLLGLYHDRHAATVIGDTVGDPFKDTSGPSLNILSKTMTMVSLMLAPAYKSIGEDEGFDGFRKFGVIIAAVMLVIVGTFCYVSVSYFRRQNKARDEESIRKKKLADEKLARERAAASAGPAATTAAADGAAAPTAVTVELSANPVSAANQA